MNMNKKKLFVALLSLVIFPSIVNAENCYYKSRDLKTVASYDIEENIKKTIVSSNEIIKIHKFKGERVGKTSNGNRSVEGYTINQCYEYLSVAKSGSIYMYKLGNSIDEVDSSNKFSEILKLNGFDKNSSEKKCELYLNKDTNYNNNIDVEKLGLDIKFSHPIYFDFITSSEGNRRFIVSYNGKSYESELSGNDSPRVLTEINDATFTLDSKYIDKFFDCSITNYNYNIRRSGSYYTLYLDETKGTVSNSGMDSDVGEWKEALCSSLSTDDCKKRQDCSLVGGTCSDAQVASNPCDENDLRRVLKIFGYVLMIMKFMVPLLIIGFGIFDLYKSVVDKDEKSLSKQIKMIGIRLICGLIVFFLPTIIYAFLDGVDKSGTKEQGYQTCAECVLKPTTNNLCTIAEDSD